MQIEMEMQKAKEKRACRGKGDGDWWAEDGSVISNGSALVGWSEEELSSVELMVKWSPEHPSFPQVSSPGLPLTSFCSPLNLVENDSIRPQAITLWAKS